jgi:exodeoxyribonuclease VII large subunit
MEVVKKRERYLATGARLAPTTLRRAGRARQERLILVMERVAASHRARMRFAHRDLARSASRHQVELLDRVVARQRERYAHIARLFQTLKETASPDALLQRGFAIVLDASGGTLRSPEQVATGDPLLIKVAHGSVTATVTDGLKARTRRTSRTRSSADQDSLL